MKARAKLVLLELIGGLFGWLWILASVAAVWFLIAALAFHGLWARFGWAFGTAVIAKWLARGFMDNQARVAFEADLVARGCSPEEAGKEWIKRYSRNERLTVERMDAPPRG